MHVRVDRAKHEVEVFAGPDGQVRVRYDGNGTIDGRPFSGEEPVPAGVEVKCDDISFVLQPWLKAAK